MKWKIILLNVLMLISTIAIKAELQTDSLLVYVVDGKLKSEEFVKNLNPNMIESMNMGVSETEAQIIENDLKVDLAGRTVVKVTLKTGANAEMKVPVYDEKSPEEIATLIHVGDKAPDFKVQMLDGTEIHLSKLKGKVVLLNFWATWCGPCMREFQELPKQIVEPFVGNDFVLLPISRGETKEVVSKKMDALKQRGVVFNVGLDSDKAIYNMYATSYIPRNFLIDKNGMVVFTSVGYDENEFFKLIEEIKIQIAK